jgi:endoglucanase
MKKLEKWSIMFLVLSFWVLICKAQPVQEHGQLKVDGIHLIDQNNKPVMLWGVSYGWHNWWPRFYNEETLGWLYNDWGCNLVRAAMGVEPDKGYLNYPEWSQQKVEAVVQGAIDNGIYVIIDWHSHHIQLEAAKTFFSAMAKKYGKYPNIIYEIYNEPVRDSWEDVKAYSVEVIKTIREQDPDNIILVGSPHWDQDLQIVADDPIKGFHNIMYTLHFYAATHKQSLRNRANDALKKGIPIFVSESAGMKANGNGSINYEEWQKWIDWMTSNKISWVTWSIADKNETCSMLNPSADSKGNWKESDLKESGIKTREYYRNLSGKNSTLKN